MESYNSIIDNISKLNLEICASGNISFRDRNKIFITPTGLSFNEVLQKGMSCYDISDRSVTGLKPSSDLNAHIDIYNYRKDIKCIYHTHSHYVTLMSMIGEDIPICNTMHADYFGADIKFIPFSNHRKAGFGELKYFLRNDYFLMGKHGGLLLFDDIDIHKIVNSIYVFEEICKLYYEYYLSKKVSSTNVEILNKDDVSSINNYYNNKYGNSSIK